MSEYVFRTEKPIEYCYDCPINNQENGRCRLGVETSGCEIPKKCLLKEVPPHDDLISRKALYEAMREHFGCDCCDKVCTSDCEYMGSDFYLVWNAPTIIEASKE